MTWRYHSIVLLVLDQLVNVKRTTLAWDSCPIILPRSLCYKKIVENLPKISSQKKVCGYLKQAESNQSSATCSNFYHGSYQLQVKIAGILQVQSLISIPYIFQHRSRVGFTVAVGIYCNFCSQIALVLRPLVRCMGSVSLTTLRVKNREPEKPQAI